jgi:hypothetical protein
LSTASPFAAGVSSFESSRSGRELSAIRQPTARDRPTPALR